MLGDGAESCFILRGSGCRCQLISPNSDSLAMLSVDHVRIIIPSRIQEPGWELDNLYGIFFILEWTNVQVD